MTRSGTVLSIRAKMEKKKSLKKHGCEKFDGENLKNGELELGARVEG